MIGLEIKRELLTGSLATWRQRALPGYAAFGGILVPALIYVAINRGNPETLAAGAPAAGSPAAGAPAAGSPPVRLERRLLSRLAP